MLLSPGVSPVEAREKIDSTFLCFYSTGNLKPDPFSVVLDFSFFALFQSELLSSAHRVRVILGDSKNTVEKESIIFKLRNEVFVLKLVCISSHDEHT